MCVKLHTVYKITHIQYGKIPLKIFTLTLWLAWLTNMSCENMCHDIQVDAFRSKHLLNLRNKLKHRRELVRFHSRSPLVSPFSEAQNRKGRRVVYIPPDCKWQKLIWIKISLKLAHWHQIHHQHSHCWRTSLDNFVCFSKAELIKNDLFS